MVALQLKVLTLAFRCCDSAEEQQPVVVVKMAALQLKKLTVA